MKRWSSAVLAVVVSLIATVGRTFGSEPEFRSEGVVVAVHRSDRALNVEEAKSGDFIERWIVRLQPPGGGDASRLAIVRYMRRFGRITNSQLNTTTWRFALRAASGWEKKNCVGPTIGEGSPMKLRASVPDDFERTAFGKGIALPEFRSLPCYLVVKAPVAVSKRETGGTAARK